jgi:hypothetical protein
VLLDSTKLIPTDAFKLGDIILTKGCRGGKEVDVFTVIRYAILKKVVFGVTGFDCSIHGSCGGLCD